MDPPQRLCHRPIATATVTRAVSQGVAGEAMVRDLNMKKHEQYWEILWLIVISITLALVAILTEDSLMVQGFM